MIKKQFIAALLLLIGFQSFAQLNKGKVMINGRGNFFAGGSKGEEYSGLYSQTITQKYSNGNFNFNLGYFFTNNFAVGLSGGVGADKHERTYFQGGSSFITEEKNQGTAAGIFLRYNRQIRDSKFGFFFQLDNSYNWGKWRYTSYSSFPTEPTLRKIHGFRTGLTPGILYFISGKVSVEASIGDISYESSVTKNQSNQNNTSEQSTSRFNSDFSMSTFYLGFTFYLGGHGTEEKKATE
jgi:hypothetical protein